MKNYFNQGPTQSGRLRKLSLTALAIGLALASGGYAHAQSIPTPVTPDVITPPQGSVAFLQGRGIGTQGYVCLP